MNGFCRRRADCRLCGSQRLTLVLQLEPTPPANAFLAAQNPTEQERFPLDLFLCEDCGHAQLLDVVDPRLLFEHYVYVSGTSPVFRAHLKAYAEEVVAQFRPPAGTLVVEIGSNDGTLLGFFKKLGYSVLGVDPARNIAQQANEAGIETLPDFFSPLIAARIRGERGPASVIAANNVLAHIDDLHGVLEGIRILLAPDGILVFEVAYLVDMITKTLFDTIYHEHLSYHSNKPLKRFLEAHGMEMIHVARVDSQGGSLRAVAKLANGRQPTHPSVAELLALEARLEADRPETFHSLARRIEARRAELASLLQQIRAEGKRVAAYGAPAKATTLLYHFALGSDTIEFIVDDNPLKQGLVTPGLHIPVLSPEAMYERRPDYVVILAWNFAASLMERHAAFREAGGRFIVPLPELSVH